MSDTTAHNLQIGLAEDGLELACIGSSCNIFAIIATVTIVTITATIKRTNNDHLILNRFFISCSLIDFF